MLPNDGRSVAKSFATRESAKLCAACIGIARRLTGVLSYPLETLVAQKTKKGEVKDEPGAEERFKGILKRALSTPPPRKQKQDKLSGGKKSAKR